jgi:hypothetical protein
VGGAGASHGGPRPPKTALKTKNFLLLFYKKEVLIYFLSQNNLTRL